MDNAERRTYWLDAIATVFLIAFLFATIVSSIALYWCGYWEGLAEGLQTPPARTVSPEGGRDEH